MANLNSPWPAISNELLMMICSHLNERRDIFALRHVCRRWFEGVNIKKFIGIREWTEEDEWQMRRRLPEYERAEDTVDLEAEPEDVLQPVTLRFDPGLGARGNNNNLSNDQYKTLGRVNLKIHQRGQQVAYPVIFIASLVTSKWAANSTVVKLDLINCLSKGQWSAIGIIILRAFRSSLETVNVQLTPGPDQIEPKASVPLGCAEVQRWESEQKAESNSCNRLKKFSIHYIIDLKIETNPAGTEDRIALGIGGPRDIFGLCPNLEYFGLNWSWRNYPTSPIPEPATYHLATATFHRSSRLIVPEAPEPEASKACIEKYWIAKISPGFGSWVHYLTPKPRHMFCYYLCHLLNTPLQDPLEKLTIVPDFHILRDVIVDNGNYKKFPSNCNTLRIVRLDGTFARAHHVEVLASTTAFKSVQSLYWAIDTLDQIRYHLHIAGLARPQEPNTLVNLKVFWLALQDLTLEDHTIGKLRKEGLAMDRWMETYLNYLAPNIERFIISASFRNGDRHCKGYPGDLQKVLNIAKTFKYIKELVIAIRHSTGPTDTNHRLKIEDVMPCLDGVETLTLAVVSAPMLVALAKFFVELCQDQEASTSRQPRKEKIIIRKIYLYQMSSDFEPDEPDTVFFDRSQLKFEIPRHIELVTPVKRRRGRRERRLWDLDLQQRTLEDLRPLAMDE